MIIHNVAKGETIKNIAEKYVASAPKIAENNGINENEPLIPGEEIFVPSATRTYTAHAFDTTTKISKRFGIKRQQLIANNPSLCGSEDIKEGQILAIKYENENLGMLAANGYIRPSCKSKVLTRAMPYIIYGTVSGSYYMGGKLHICENAEVLARTLAANNKIPLLRIYDKSGGAFMKDERDSFIDKAINESKRHGFYGIVLAAYEAERQNYNAFCDFIVNIRKKMIGSDLIFFLEGTKDTNRLCAELSDGSILSFSDFSEISGNKSYEKDLSVYARNTESSKILIDIPTFAMKGNEFIPISEARSICAERGGFAVHDKKTELSAYILPTGEKYIFESISNIKAKLTLLYELGYMGVSFDIESTPISYLMMLHTMFTPVGYIGKMG